MDSLLLLAILPGGVAVVLALLAVEEYVRARGSLLHLAWDGYAAWFRPRAEYLLDRQPLSARALQHFAVALAGLGGGFLLGSGPLVCAAAFVAAVLAPFLLYQRRVQERREQLLQQIDPALQFIANTLQVTPNLEEALVLVSAYFKPPISEEVAQVVARYRLGQRLEEALQGMADRCSDPFITSMVIALAVGRRTGGDVAATLRRIAHTTRESVRIELELLSKTKGQRSQFYVVVLLYPLGLLALKSNLPEAWTQLLTTHTGQVVLFLSAAVVGTAVLWAQKILSPDKL